MATTYRIRVAVFAALVMLVVANAEVLKLSCFVLYKFDNPKCKECCANSGLKAEPTDQGDCECILGKALEFKLTYPKVLGNELNESDLQALKKREYY